MSSTPYYDDSHFVCETSGGVVEFGPTCLLVFIDETGHETFAPGHSLFGLGGCAVMVEDYLEEIVRPWNKLKSDLFNGPDVALHASGMGLATSQQKQGIGDFFRTHRFARVSTTIGYSIFNETDIGAYEIVAGSLQNRIMDVAKHTRFTAKALIFEASDRGDRLAVRHFYNFNQIEVERHGGSFDAPVTKLIAGKGVSPGQEIGDFIMHAAQGRARAYFQNGSTKHRRDYDAVFNGFDKHLASDLMITRVMDNAMKKT